MANIRNLQQGAAQSHAVPDSRPFMPPASRNETVYNTTAAQEAAWAAKRAEENQRAKEWNPPKTGPSVEGNNMGNALLDEAKKLIPRVEVNMRQEEKETDQSAYNPITPYTPTTNTDPDPTNESEVENLPKPEIPSARLPTTQIKVDPGASSKITAQPTIPKPNPPPVQNR
jgi:hypothetical protein